jgi:hypothetical protein
MCCAHNLGVCGLWGLEDVLPEKEARLEKEHGLQQRDLVVLVVHFQLLLMSFQESARKVMDVFCCTRPTFVDKVTRVWQELYCTAIGAHRSPNSSLLEVIKALSHWATAAKWFQSTAIKCS